MYCYYYMVNGRNLPGIALLLHEKDISAEKLQMWENNAHTAGATSLPKVLDHLVQNHGFVKPRFGGFIHIVFPK